ncbi:hypothetical protein ACFV24_25760 [Nocardia fluminea]|uniref:hypothetical protein n=1 Tax=Nocardia fluminea TaxID=134984 RepID=UPI00366B96D4
MEVDPLGDTPLYYTREFAVDDADGVGDWAMERLGISWPARHETARQTHKA